MTYMSLLANAMSTTWCIRIFFSSKKFTIWADSYNSMNLVIQGAICVVRAFLPTLYPVRHRSCARFLGGKTTTQMFTTVLASMYSTPIHKELIVTVITWFHCEQKSPRPNGYHWTADKIKADQVSSRRIWQELSAQTEEGSGRVLHNVFNHSPGHTRGVQLSRVTEKVERGHRWGAGKRSAGPHFYPYRTRISSHNLRLCSAYTKHMYKYNYKTPMVNKHQNKANKNISQ